MSLQEAQDSGLAPLNSGELRSPSPSNETFSREEAAEVSLAVSLGRRLIIRPVFKCKHSDVLSSALGRQLVPLCACHTLDACSCSYGRRCKRCVPTCNV